MENGKHTIKTDFGLGGQETEITFYKCLQGNKQAKDTVESLMKAERNMWDLMNQIEKKHPEYYERLLSTVRAIQEVKWDLDKQVDGYIMY